MSRSLLGQTMVLDPYDPALRDLRGELVRVVEKSPSARNVYGCELLNPQYRLCAWVRVNAETELVTETEWRARKLTRVMAHFEKVWRSRTPSKDVTDVLAINRCTFTDLFAEFPELAKDPGGSRQWLAPEIRKTLLRLRREFPEERWDGINHLTLLPSEEI